MYTLNDVKTWNLCTYDKSPCIIPSSIQIREDVRKQCWENPQIGLVNTGPSTMPHKLAFKFQKVKQIKSKWVLLTCTLLLESIQIFSVEQQYVFVFHRQKSQQHRDFHRLHCRRFRSPDHHPCALIPCCQVDARAATAQWRSSRTCDAQEEPALHSAQLFI